MLYKRADRQTDTHTHTHAHTHTHTHTHATSAVEEVSQATES